MDKSAQIHIISLQLNSEMRRMKKQWKDKKR